MSRFVTHYPKQCEATPCPWFFSSLGAFQKNSCHWKLRLLWKLLALELRLLHSGMKQNMISWPVTWHTFITISKEYVTIFFRVEYLKQTQVLLKGYSTPTRSRGLTDHLGRACVLQLSVQKVTRQNFGVAARYPVRYLTHFSSLCWRTLPCCFKSAYDHVLHCSHSLFISHHIIPRYIIWYLRINAREHGVTTQQTVIFTGSVVWHTGLAEAGDNMSTCERRLPRDWRQLHNNKRCNMFFSINYYRAR